MKRVPKNQEKNNNKWVAKYTKFQANKLSGPYETTKDSLRACTQNWNLAGHFLRAKAEMIISRKISDRAVPTFNPKMWIIKI